MVVLKNSIDRALWMFILGSTLVVMFVVSALVMYTGSPIMIHFIWAPICWFCGATMVWGFERLWPVFVEKCKTIRSSNSEAE